jgi:hypothetical protein
VAVVAKSHVRLRLGVPQCSAAFTLKIQRELFRIFDAILRFDQKSDGFLPVDCSVIVTER